VKTMMIRRDLPYNRDLATWKHKPSTEDGPKSPYPQPRSSRIQENTLQSKQQAKYHNNATTHPPLYPPPLGHRNPPHPLHPHPRRPRLVDNVSERTRLCPQGRPRSRRHQRLLHHKRLHWKCLRSRRRQTRWRPGWSLGKLQMGNVCTADLVSESVLRGLRLGK
jgi:hypothetical protein